MKKNISSAKIQGVSSVESCVFHSFAEPIESHALEVIEERELNESGLLAAPSYDKIDASDMKILSEGIQMLFINDHEKLIFYPVISINLRRIIVKSSLLNNQALI